ncbi:MAG: ABC transporter ATP-binding protein [Solirubrobacteraceae bacterium]
MAGAKVRLKDVCRDFGYTPVIRDVSFTVEPGCVVALTGPSGAGKTTLLQMIGSLDRPSSGSIYVDEVAVNALRDPVRYRRETVGFVFQLHHLLPQLTVRDNVELPMVASHVHKHTRHERSAELLEAVGLDARSGALPADLSGGERQRVAIARALAGRPRLILADEPTGSLDGDSAARVWALLVQARDRFGSTVIVASHDESLMSHVDRELTIVDGTIREVSDSERRDIALTRTSLRQVTQPETLP